MLVWAIAFVVWVLADIPPEIERKKLFLAIEVRTPAGSPAPARLPGVGYVFEPLPYQGWRGPWQPGKPRGYTLLPAGEPLRNEVVRILVEELHGTRLSDDRDGTRRVRVNGKVLNITLGLETVSVTMDFGRADAALLDMVAAHNTDAEQRRFITKLKSKINEGLALSGRSAALARN